jgi:hypothetical protein
MPLANDCPSLVSTIKDVATIATSLVATITILIVILKLRVEHPGYKLVLEKELKLYDAFEELETELAPYLTRSTEEVEVEPEKLIAIREKIKRIANSVYAPDDIRSPMNALNVFLREMIEGSQGQLVKLQTQALLLEWTDCKNAARKRITRLVTPHRPYRLYTVDSGGRYSFVNNFPSRWARRRYMRKHRIHEPDKKYAFWPENENPGLLERFRG